MKMTKEEAIEFLKNKKIYANGKNSEILRKLSDLGFIYLYDDSVIFNEYPFIMLSDDKLITASKSMITFNKCSYDEISAEDVYSIEIDKNIYVPMFGDIVKITTDITTYQRDYIITIMPDKELPMQRTEYFFDIASITLNGNLRFDLGAVYDPSYPIEIASSEEVQEL